MDTLQLPETIAGKITFYRFELPRDEKIMNEVLGPLYAMGRKPQETYAGDQVWERDNYKYRPMKAPLEERTVHFELDFLSTDQWIVRHKEDRLGYMDWTQYALPNKSIIMGYFVHLSTEMKQIRADWARCGYCGKREHVRILLGEKRAHCDKCLGSPLMTKKNMGLTVYTTYMGKQVLPALKGEALEARWVSHVDKAFFSGTPVHALKQKQQDLDDREAKVLELFRIERAGLSWLEDHGFNIKHVLFSQHRGGVFFLHEVDREDHTLDVLKEKLKDFPFQFDIK